MFSMEPARALDERHRGAKTRSRLMELAAKGAIVFEERLSSGSLPEILLTRKTRLDRIVKASKR
jgi:hypothetical protein